MLLVSGKLPLVSEVLNATTQVMAVRRLKIFILRPLDAGIEVECILTRKLLMEQRIVGWDSHIFYVFDTRS